MDRRSLLKNLCALGAVAALPLAASTAKPPVDEYGLFLERVRQRIIEIVRREGRGPRKIWIDPPRADGSRYVRKIHLVLEPGGSLLDRLHFEFEEPSGSRLRVFDR